MIQSIDTRLGKFESKEFKFEYELKKNEQLTIELPFLYTNFNSFTLKVIIFNNVDTTKNLGIFIDGIMVNLQFLDLTEVDYIFNRTTVAKILFESVKQESNINGIRVKNEMLSLFELQNQQEVKLTPYQIYSIVSKAISKISNNGFFTISQNEQLINIKLNEKMITDKIAAEQLNEDYNLAPIIKKTRLSPQELSFYLQIRHLVEVDLPSIILLRNLLKKILNTEENNLYILWAKFSLNKNTRLIASSLREENIEERLLQYLQNLGLVSLGK